VALHLHNKKRKVDDFIQKGKKKKEEKNVDLVKMRGKMFIP